MYILTCPNCGNADTFEEVEYQVFECTCGEDFGIERAGYEEE